MTELKTMILGGVRSGKSRLAERLAQGSGLPVTYIATATVHDDEMRMRVDIHRSRRPSHWQLVEEPVRLAEALQEHAVNGHCVLVDCMTLWLTNLFMAQDESAFDRERTKLIEIFPTLKGHVILVSNETNMGVVPLGELSRRYCDEAGWLHQDLAQLCDRVVLTVAGLPQILKGDPL